MIPDIKVKALDVARRTLVKKVAKLAKSTQFKNFQHAAALIRKTAQASIDVAPIDTAGEQRQKEAQERRRAKPKKRDSKGRFLKQPAKRSSQQRKRKPKKPTVPSRPGEPPHTRSRQLVRAIIFHADEHGAIIGPRHSFMGEAAAAHEHGAEHMGREYPERPFMGPALEENATRFAMTWTGSIGE